MNIKIINIVGSIFSLLFCCGGGIYLAGYLGVYKALFSWRKKFGKSEWLLFIVELCLGIMAIVIGLYLNLPYILQFYND
jgi:hypothetical protein